MHIKRHVVKASRPAQLLAMLVTTALVILGITTLPTYAAAPTLKLAINADEDSYLSGVEQRYVVEFSCASTTEDCLDSVVTITLPHTITPGSNSNPDSAPEGINATATAGNKVVTPEIKRPTGTTDGLVTYNLGTVAAGTSSRPCSPSPRRAASPPAAPRSPPSPPSPPATRPSRRTTASRSRPNRPRSCRKPAPSPPPRTST